MSGFSLYETVKTRTLVHNSKTNMSESTELSLKHFYIYNDSYGQKEGEVSINEFNSTKSFAHTAYLLSVASFSLTLYKLLIDVVIILA